MVRCTPAPGPGHPQGAPQAAPQARRSPADAPGPPLPPSLPPLPLSQELLADDVSEALSLSSLSCDAPDNFPCIADELEEQAKQLEEDWCAPQGGRRRVPARTHAMRSRLPLGHRMLVGLPLPAA